MTPIKDNIELTIRHVRLKNPVCAQPLTDMIFGKIEEQRDAGWNITYLGSLLSDDGAYVWTVPGSSLQQDENERVFFYLMKTNQKGQGIDVCAFLVIDLTAGTVTDCSQNIVTTH